MTGWPDLLATALVGTDRRGAATDEAAQTLLDEAAGWTLYRRAGVRTVDGLPAADPAPAESRPVVPPAAADRLAVLADPESDGLDATTRLELLGEWLSTVVSRDRRVPGEHLPDLFELARRHVHLRRLVVAAAGARAGWLAGLNPEWTFLTATPDRSAAADPASWLEGTPGQRAGHLAERRRADPPAARALLADEWGTLGPDERAGLLAELAVNLDRADEDFLEQALDDRRKEVRSVAVGLLASLPGSAYNARMAERARACLTVVRGRLVVTPPTEFDPALRRDGVEPRPPARTGERAWWLRQILARAPLPESVAPVALLSTVDEWADELYRGLAQAAAQRRDPRWAAVLLDLLAPRLKPGDVDWPVVEELYAALPPDDLVARAEDALADPAGGLGRLLVRLLAECPVPWPDRLAIAVLSGLETHARRDRMPYDLFAVGRLAAVRMPPTLAGADQAGNLGGAGHGSSLADLAAAAADRFRADPPDPTRPNNGRVEVFDRLTMVLRLRHEMIREIP